MIKLERPDCPPELTKEVVEALTEKFKADCKCQVWNDPSVYMPLREALAGMAHSKCAYCECKINKESKDLTIDHFRSKSKHPDSVLEWKNLLPACLRCNRKKNASSEEIINPAEKEPRKYLCFKLSDYKILGKKDDILGKATVTALDLNDIDRVCVPRYSIGQKLKEKTEEILEAIELRLSANKRPTPENTRAVLKIMEMALPDRKYSAALATVLLNNKEFDEIKKILEREGIWNEGLQSIYEELEGIKLDLSE